MHTLTFGRHSMTISSSAAPAETRLGWLDSPQHYGLISRTLHWLMALMIVWQFVGMTLRLLLGRTPLVAFFVKWHPIVGSLLLVLILLRLSWAWYNRQQRPPQGSGVVGSFARLGHGALYALMLLIPLLGMLRLYGSGRGFSPFGVEIFAATGQEIAWTIALADRLHGEFAWTLLALILGHIIMVIVHERRWQDGTLARMLRSRRRPAR